MLNRSECIDIIRSAQPTLTQVYGVRSLLLFGSIAREEQRTESDVDVCVEMAPNLLNRIGVKHFLEERLHCPVDVVRMRDSMNSTLKQQINKDGIPVF